MRSHYPSVIQIIYAVGTIGGAIYGMAAHGSYGMGLAICGIIGGVLALIAVTLLILVSAVVWSVICSHRPSDFKFSTYKKSKK